MYGIRKKEGTRFENTAVPETIRRDLFSSVEYPSHANESDAGGTPIKHDRTR